MWLHSYLLILLYVANKCWALGDDGDWGKKKIMIRYSSIDPNTPTSEEFTYSWEGVIKSMFGDEKNTCLTLDVVNEDPSKKSEPGYKPFGVPIAGTAVGIFKCPDSVGGAPLHQTWFIKGKVAGGLDSDPVFEGYIRSSQPSRNGERLCLTARMDPSKTPLTMWRDGGGGGWHPQARFYNWEERQGKTDQNELFWNHHNLYTSWGVVYVDYCRENDPSQTWLVGLTTKDDDVRPDDDDPKKWTWIRPREMGPTPCLQPFRDRDVNKQEDSERGLNWCKTAWNCPPNYPYHPGLMRPWINPGKVDAETKVQWVMVGCSPSNWMLQYNFGLLNKAKGDIRDEIIDKTVPDTRIPPMYSDPDLEPVR